MLVVFGLLAVAQTGSLYSKQNSSLPIRCALIGSLPRSAGAVEAAGIVLFLAVSCINRIMRLWSFDPDGSIQTLLVQGLVAIIRRRTVLHNLVTMAVISSKKSKSEQGIAYQIFWDRRRRTRSCDILEQKYLVSLEEWPGFSSSCKSYKARCQEISSHCNLEWRLALHRSFRARRMCLVGFVSVIRTP